MSATTETTSKLNDVVSIMRDGVTFYNDAIEQVDNPGLNSVFRRYRDAKQELVTDLSSAVSLRGEDPEDSGTTVGTFREGYAKLKASLGNTDKAFVDELEEHEDHALHKVQDLLEDDGTPTEAKAVLNRVYPEIKKLHDDMANIKENIH